MAYSSSDLIGYHKPTLKYKAISFAAKESVLSLLYFLVLPNTFFILTFVLLYNPLLSSYKRWLNIRSNLVKKLWLEFIFHTAKFKMEDSGETLGPVKEIRMIQKVFFTYFLQESRLLNSSKIQSDEWTSLNLIPPLIHRFCRWSE